MKPLPPEADAQANGHLDKAFGLLPQRLDLPNPNPHNHPNLPNPNPHNHPNPNPNPHIHHPPIPPLDVRAASIRLETEQEKTKQVQHKVELARVVLDILKEAKAHSIGDDVLRRLFAELEDAPRLQSPTAQSKQVQTPPSARDKTKPENLGDMLKTKDNAHSRANLPRLENLSRLENLPRLENVPRLENLPPPRQQPLPVSHSQPKLCYLPLAQTSHASSESHTVAGSPKDNLPPLMKTLPVPVYQHMYPVYYQVPEKTSFRPEEKEALGLPYSGRNYSTLMYQPRFLQGSLQQQQPAYYYMKSSQLGQMMPAPYFVPPPPPGKVVPWPALAEPLNPLKEEEQQPKRKKTKTNLNFMISTPKNPPAKKYNK